MQSRQDEREFLDTLTQRYEEEIVQCRQEYQAAENRIREASAGFAEKRLELYFMKQLVEAKQTTLATALSPAGQLTITEDALNTAYQEALTRAFETQILPYCENQIAERASVYRDGQLHLLDTPEAKTAEFERRKAALTQGIVADYRLFHFHQSADLLALQQNLRREMNSFESQEDALNAEYSRTVMPLEDAKNALGARVRQREKWLTDQKNSLSTYHPTQLEQWVLLRCTSAVQRELETFTDTPAQHLQETAPHAFTYACWTANPLFVRLFLESHISAAAADTLPQRTTHYYPVHFVAMSNANEADQIECLEILKAHQADLFTEDANYHRTALHTAALFGNVRVAAWLIQEKRKISSSTDVIAWINQPEQGRFAKRTALHYAASNVDIPSMRLLLNAGADASLLNQEGRTPLLEVLCSDTPDYEHKHAGLRCLQEYGVFCSINEFNTLTDCIRPVFTTHILPILQAFICRQPALERWIAAYHDRQTDAARPVENIQHDLAAQHLARTLPSEKFTVEDVYQLAMYLRRAQLYVPNQIADPTITFLDNNARYAPVIAEKIDDLQLAGKLNRETFESLKQEIASNKNSAEAGAGAEVEASGPSAFDADKTRPAPRR